MEAAFWHDRWSSNEIGFHEGEPNTMMVRHFPSLGIPEGGRVFVPLCGKTRDIHWLLEQGYHVAGAELSRLAVEQLFEELGMTPSVEEKEALLHYTAEGIDIYEGDICHLSARELGPVDAIYDRAALVALPEAMRAEYRAHLMDLCGGATQFLLTLEYEPGLIDGPPFAIPEGDVRTYYGGAYDIVAVDCYHAESGLRGKYPYTERAWHLR